MKLVSTLTISALLTAGSAFAATPPTATAGATATPAAPMKHESTMHCQKQAQEKKLTGDAEKKFVKECRHAAKPD